jgi:putative endonuclease
MKKSEHYILGKRGEARAEEYLCTAGYQIVEKNYTTPFGEIDIIARDDKTICFVEVKTRSSRLCGTPADAVTPAKRDKITRTARCYVEANTKKKYEYRFDVIELFYDAELGDFIEIYHIPDAFENEED